jgi:hypothetical protein
MQDPKRDDSDFILVPVGINRQLDMLLPYELEDIRQCLVREQRNHVFHQRLWVLAVRRDTGRTTLCTSSIRVPRAVSGRHTHLFHIGSLRQFRLTEGVHTRLGHFEMC